MDHHEPVKIILDLPGEQVVMIVPKFQHIPPNVETLDRKTSWQYPSSSHPVNMTYDTEGLEVKIFEPGYGPKPERLIFNFEPDGPDDLELPENP